MALDGSRPDRGMISNQGHSRKHTKQALIGRLQIGGQSTRNRRSIDGCASTE